MRCPPGSRRCNTRRAMDFDLQWLLWGLPLAFAFGWLASRWDVRQWKREHAESPKLYYRGLKIGRAHV